MRNELPKEYVTANIIWDKIKENLNCRSGLGFEFVDLTIMHEIDIEITKLIRESIKENK